MSASTIHIAAACIDLAADDEWSLRRCDVYRVLAVAQISSTSVRMIEQHYGHLSGERSAAALAGLAL